MKHQLTPQAALDDTTVVRRILLHVQPSLLYVRTHVGVGGPDPTTRWRRVTWAVLFFLLGLGFPGAALAAMLFHFRGELVGDGYNVWLMWGTTMLFLLLVLLPIFALAFGEAPRLRKKLLRHPEIARGILADLERDDAAMGMLWKVPVHEVRKKLRKARKDAATDAR